MAIAATTPAWQRAVIVLTGTMVSVVAIGCLYWAQMILMPLALALFLAFLLSPLMIALQHRGLGRAPAAVLVVLCATFVLSGVVWLITSQVTSLLGDLPAYKQNIKVKVRSIQELSQSSAAMRLRQMVQEISGELKAPAQAGPAEETTTPLGSAHQEKPTPVVVEPQTPSWMSWLLSSFHGLAETLGSGLLVLVLLVFMLLRREDLRNRVIRLVGHGRITMTTKAVEEAGQRISRFLIMQALVNGAFGLTLIVGLRLIGVQYALLWGFLAAILRYIPYLGIWFAAVPTITMCLAQYAGWTQPLLVIGLFLVIELLTSNFLEPWLYGQSMGVSELALLVAAAFWAFLWGPIGMVLSSPITVCLVVLGKYVPQLNFLDILLGDEPALPINVSYYQRLLAHDQDEATELVLTQLHNGSADKVYDDLLLPALNFTKRDHEQAGLSEEDEQFVFQTTAEIIEDVSEYQANETGDTLASEPAPHVQVRLLGCPSRDRADELALKMLRQLLDPQRWALEVVSVDTLIAEFAEHVAESPPAVICIASLPPGGTAHTRYLCKRLRAQFPHVKIMVGRWGLLDKVAQTHESLRAAGADQVAKTLVETRSQLESWYPVFAQEQDVQPAKVRQPETMTV